MNKPNNPFILNLSREGEKIRISAFEKRLEEAQTLKHYEDNPISIDVIEGLCKEVVHILNRANKRGDLSPEIIKGLKKAGQTLYDELLTPKAKSALRSTTSEDLLLYIDDQLVQVPWELLFDGEAFLCLKFNMGRVVRTRQNITGIQKRTPGKSLKMLIIADPQSNLKAAYKEGIKVRDELSGKEDIIKLNLVSASTDTQYIKRNIRDFDIIHFAGHAEYDPEDPSQSGWVMSDKKLTSSDISKMAGGAPLPSLVFSNACHSGRTSEWHVAGDFEEQIYGLANAFLLSGVTHYIGTFWDILDSPSSDFAVEFYKAIAKNLSLGESVRTARKRLIEQFGEGNIIWAGYMLYGDPTYKVFQTASTESYKANQQPREIVKDSPGIEEEPAQLRSPSGLTDSKPQESAKGLNLKILYGGGIALLALLSILIYMYSTKSAVPTGAENPKPAQDTQQIMLTSETIAPLELSMNIIGQREDVDGNFSEVIVKEGSILHSYDNFQVHFKTNKDAYVYILIYDSDNKANLLFPDPKIPLDNKIKADTSYSVPSPSLWFWLDENVGIETIYVLAAEKPLDDIKTLLLEMEGADDQKKTELSNRIRKTIGNLERGVGGITQGKAKSFYLKNGKEIQKVTEIIKGKTSVVRAISFRHIDGSVFKELSALQEAGGKRVDKEEPGSKQLRALVSRGEKAVNDLMSSIGSKSVDADRIAESLINIKKNLILEESRGVGGITVYKRAAPAVVLVVTNESSGSGSILDKKGLILTNWHVVKGYERVAVLFKPKKGIELTKELVYTAKVVKVDEVSDLALLKIEKPPDSLPTLKLGTINDVEIAQDVHAIGHPGGEIWTYTKGIISQIRPGYEWTYDNIIRHKSKVIQTQTPINPGNSGGPLLNDKAEIIGINSFVKRGEGLNFAVSVDVIKNFLERKESRIARKPTIPDSLKNLTYFEYDLNKDGITDVLGVDLDKNGLIDLYFVDMNHDGEIDYTGLDQDENQKIETKVYDTDKNEKYDTWAFDFDENGTIDLYGLDYNEDGVIDEYVES